MLNALSRFRKAREGLAAVEFALIAPVMIALLLGTVELCNALECRQKVSMEASTGADLVAQTTTISSGDLSNVFAAMAAIGYPFSSSNARIVITSIVSDGKGGGTVAWSQAQNTAKMQQNKTVTDLPSGLMPKDLCDLGQCSVIKVQVSYDYASPIGRFIVGTINMGQTFYSRPRRSATVTCSDCTS